MTQLSILPPSNIELESLVLGTLLQESKSILEIEGRLKVDTFYKEEHKTIYAAIEFLHNSGMEIDIRSVTTKLRKENLLNEIGGALYLSAFTDTMSYNFIADVNELKEIYTNRKLIELCQRAIRDIGKMGAIEQLERIEKEVFSLSVNNTNSIETLSTLASKTLLEMSAQSKIEGYAGVASGFKLLDNITGGFQSSNLVVVGAGTSMGKTSFGLNLAANAFNAGKKVLLFSLEMSKKQVTKRFLAMNSGINSKKLRDSKGLEVAEWESLSASSTNFEQVNMFIDDIAGQTVSEIRTKARSIKQRFGLDILIIDYLQLIKCSEKGLNREQEVSTIASDLHALSKELDIPVLTFSQINKEHEKGDKRPTLSGLRESAGIGNASDLVILLHRPEFWGVNEDENGRSLKGITELIIAKHRDGELGTVKISFKAETGKFTDVEDDFDDYIVPTNRASDNVKPQKTDIGDVPF